MISASIFEHFSLMELDSPWGVWDITRVSRKEWYTQYKNSEHGKAMLKKNWDDRHKVRRSAERSTPNRLTQRQWRIILKAYANHCAYCDIEMTTTGDAYQLNYVTLDHVIPISKGGTNTRSNVVPACRACNKKKRNDDTWSPNPPKLPLRF